MAISDSSDIANKLFFCTGLTEKSGTTFLQRALNLHPEVSCPAEHNFPTLLEPLQKLVNQYAQVHRQLDNRTGGQGTLPFGKDLAIKTFKFMSEEIIRSSAEGKPIAGANDNTAIKNLNLLNDIFNHPKLIVITRHPVDVAISAWDHNTRLAKEENNSEHIGLMEKHGDLYGWVDHIVGNWIARSKKLLKYQVENSNLLVVQYEELRRDRRNSLRNIFAYLGANTEAHVIDEIVAATDIKVMRHNSKHASFFAEGGRSRWNGRIDAKFVKDLIEKNSQELELMGYS